MHGFRWPVRGMVDSCVFACARLFADRASLVPHVAAHMKCSQITLENLVH